MGRLIKPLVYLGVIGLLGLTGFAYLGDLRPEQTEIRVPVDLNVNN